MKFAALVCLIMCSVNAAFAQSDMDALPVREETDYPFRSMDTAVFGRQTTGVMHACGHDIHTSVMLGVAGVPAEEGAPPGEEGGASLMLKEGVFKELHPDVIYGLHSDPSLEVGQLGYSLGATNASISDFSMRIIGRSAHAASPELSVDPYAISSGRIFEQGYFDMVVHEIATGIRKNQSTLLAFDSAYFHTQDEIEAEMREAGFQSISSYGVLGLSGNLPDLEAVVDDDDKRQRLPALAEIMEPYPIRGSKIMTVGVNGD